jgi:hypothetical protein
MPRQNFLSRESFVEATEYQAKESLLSIPVFASAIKLITENKMLQSFRFLYLSPKNNAEYYIEVSVLRLNELYTRVSLHGTHVNGHAFTNDADMAIALHDFESALQAAIKGDASLYKPYQPKEKTSKRFVHMAATLAASAGVFFLRKKLS